MLKYIASLRHPTALLVKKAIWGSRGEPYRFAGHKLRFVPGTRPVRQKYRHSQNAVVRFDALQIDYYEQNISRGSVCLDVGGHNGQCAVLMAILAGPGGRVISFEPDTILAENAALNADAAKIDIEPFAVSDSNGEARFFDGKGNANSSLAAVGSVSDCGSIMVSTIALDDFLAARSIHEVSLMKIDIEGAEIHALRGASQILKSNCKILVELHPYAWTEFGVSFHELMDMAAASNRELVYLDEQTTVTENPHYGTVLMRKRRDHT